MNLSLCTTPKEELEMGSTKTGVKMSAPSKPESEGSGSLPVDQRVLQELLQERDRSRELLAGISRACHCAKLAITELEERFRLVADAAPVMIRMSGRDKLCNYFNKNWLAFTGRPVEHDLGDGWSMGVHPDDLQRCLCTYAEAFDARQVFLMEYRLRRFDGEYRWIRDTGVPRMGPDHTFEGYIDSCIDMTDQKRAAEALHEDEGQVASRTHEVDESGAFRERIAAPPRQRATGSRRARVLLADEHTVAAHGLANLLQEDFELVGIVPDGIQLVEVARQLRPDLIVADISMPGLDGLEALRRLRSEGIAPPFVFLNTRTEAGLAVEAVRAGVAGYLAKQSAGDELLAALQEVLQGHPYLTPALAGDVLEGLAAPERSSDIQLTPRQGDVVRLVAEGLSMKDIAARLHLSRRTVETHKYEAMQALGLRTTAQLIRYAVQADAAEQLGHVRVPQV
jgi:PAS domain S-box-containing protein